jgi:hypothetical protein
LRLALDLPTPSSPAGAAPPARPSETENPRKRPLALPIRITPTALPAGMRLITLLCCSVSWVPAGVHPGLRAGAGMTFVEHVRASHTVIPAGAAVPQLTAVARHQVHLSAHTSGDRAQALFDLGQA